MAPCIAFYCADGGFYRSTTKPFLTICEQLTITLHTFGNKKYDDKNTQVIHVC
eukprot:m.383680 g.383680  ORF g.383680 m.383680 type:complete len:53 (-) comp20983_c0_seq1:95-253(-)